MNSEWPLVRLGDYCLKIGSGATPKGGKESYLEAGPYSLVRSQNVHNDGFKRQGLAYISELQARKLDGVAVAAGDVLINITGDSVARACLAPERILPARVNQHVAIVRPNPAEFDSRYLRYFLIAPAQQDLLLGLAAGGATRNALTKAMLENLLVPKPPLEVQQAIAEPLAVLEERSEVFRDTNAALESIAQAVFKSWFVDFEPVVAKAEGREPDGIDAETAALFPSEFEETAAGLIPKGWTVTDVGAVSELIYSGGTPDTQNVDYWNGDLCWFSSGETRDRFVVATEKKITLVAVAESSTRLALPGDILIASAGQGRTRGQTSYCGIETYINQSVVSVRADSVHCNSIWLFYNLSRRYEEMRAISDSHSSRGSLTTKLIASLPICKPSLELVQAFVFRVEPLVKAQILGVQQISCLNGVLQTLLPSLISGQLITPGH